jgi:hypothetical protein
VAAAVTTGRALPGGVPSEPADVILISYEDGIGDTIRPRLEAAGADLTRVHVITWISVTADLDRLVVLPADARSIFDVAKKFDASLVIIDPLTAALSSETDAHRDTDVRRALAPLAALAEALGIAVLVVRHLRKSGGSAISSGGGSIGIAGAARSVLGVYKDPDVEGGRLLACVKNNLAAPAPALGFRLASEPGQSARVVWGGESRRTADDLAGLRGADGDDDGGHHEVDEWLRGVLGADGCDRKELLKAGGENGFSASSIQRAGSRLGVQRSRSGFGRDQRSRWTLPCESRSTISAEQESLTVMTDMGQPSSDWDGCPECGCPGPRPNGCPNCRELAGAPA